jgi:hypothetical protein
VVGPGDWGNGAGEEKVAGVKVSGSEGVEDDDCN